MTLAILAYSLVSFLLGFLSILWHKLREQGKPLEMASIGLVMDVLNDLPLVVMVLTLDWRMLVAGYGGTFLGTLVAGKRSKRVVGGHRDNGLQPQETISSGIGQIMVYHGRLEDQQFYKDMLLAAGTAAVDSSVPGEPKDP
jgi:hypothetical protein